MTYYNSLNKFYKSKLGAVCAEEQVTFRVKGNFGSVVLLLKKDGCECEKKYEMVKNAVNIYCEML